MNKTIHSVLVAIVSGFFVYISNLAVMMLSYCSMSLVSFRFCFTALLLIGAVSAGTGILYRNRTVGQGALRWLFMLVCFAVLFMINGCLGTLDLLCDLFNLTVNSSSDNVSGLLALNHFFVVAVASLLVVIGTVVIYLHNKLFVGKVFDNPPPPVLN